MINWQEWVVGVLVVLCIARIIYGIFLFFRRTRENKNPCDSCVSGCELKKYKEKLLWIVGNFKICTTFATANKKNGSLDEWLSQRSAKPCTAVRIRQEPLRKDLVTV